MQYAYVGAIEACLFTETDLGTGGDHVESIN
jgi:hypothetical protein